MYFYLIIVSLHNIFVNNSHMNGVVFIIKESFGQFKSKAFLILTPTLGFFHVLDYNAVHRDRVIIIALVVVLHAEPGSRPWTH